jgi:hypothetical protein
MLIILETHSGEHTTATKFEASREILEFQESFLEFPINLVVRIRKNVNIGETGKPVIDPEV